jgi:hypothetical protein
MNFPWLIFWAVVAYLAWKTQRSVQRSASERERALAIRGAVVFWILGFIFIGALLFLPNKARVLMMIPAFLIAGSIVKAYRSSRARLKAEQEGDVAFEKMKRVN